MSFEAVNPIWRAVRDRFNKMVAGLQDEELALKLSEDTSSIGHMIRHNAEVEYMFADWFFGKGMPSEVTIYTGRGAAHATEQFTDLQELISFSEGADRYITEAMRELPEEEWDVVKPSAIGPSSPREAVARMLYHTGIHAGQISLIRKCAPAANRS